jgi:hypothetical protein
MKINPIIVAGALSLGFVSLADATQYVYLTGSTACRSIVYATLNSTAVFDAAPQFTGYSSSTASKCTWMEFSGNIGGNATIVKCYWSGSEAGISDVVNGSSEQFLNDPGVGGVDNGNTGNSATPSGSQLVTHTVDLAMADNKQSFSQNPKPVLANGTEVAVITFTFVKEKGSKAGLVNVTDAQFRQAITGGAKLALFTGNSADTSFVYISGRDNLSGTRVNFFGETGFGISSQPSQVEIDSGGNMLDPNGDSTYVTTSGYSSGGSVATQMGYDVSDTTDQINGGTGISVIGYLGRSDANTAISNGGTELTYNGITQSAAAVIEGQYSIWGNEYVYQANGASSQAQTVYGKLVSGIPANCDGSTAIKLSAMHATRGGPTTDPIHN